MEWRQALVGATLALAVWPGLTSAIFAPRWAALSIGLGLAWQLGNRPLAWWLLAGSGLAWAATSLLWMPDRMTGFYDFSLLALIVLLAWQDWDLDSVIIGFGGGLLASSALLLFEATSGRQLEAGTPMSGLFFNRDFLAEAAALVAVWSLLRRCWPILLVAAIPLVLCQSRVAIGAVLLALGWHWARQRWWRIGALATLLAIAVGIGLFGFGAAKLASAESRLTGWNIGLALMSWQGLGIGWWHGQVPFGHLVHSDLLRAADELGLGALPIGGFGIWLLARGPWSVAKAVWLALVCEALLSFPLHLPATAFLGAVVAGSLGRRRAVVPLGHSIGRAPCWKSRDPDFPVAGAERCREVSF